MGSTIGKVLFLLLITFIKSLESCKCAVWTVTPMIYILGYIMSLSYTLNKNVFSLLNVVSVMSGARSAAGRLFHTYVYCSCMLIYCVCCIWNGGSLFCLRFVYESVVRVLFTGGQFIMCCTLQQHGVVLSVCWDNASDSAFSVQCRLYKCFYHVFLSFSADHFLERLVFLKTT